MTKATPKFSEKAKNQSARLYAVQVIYQSWLSKKGAEAVWEEYRLHRMEEMLNSEPLVKPNGSLVKKIVKGVEERKDDLKAVISGHINKETKNVDQLLSAILFCGAFEIMAHDDIDLGIIVNDYLNVGHAYYEPSEVGFINGILDGIAKTIRAETA